MRWLVFHGVGELEDETGYGQDDDRQRSRQAGIDLHLVKPANLDDLETVLKRFEQILIP